MGIRPGLSARVSLTVGEGDTAEAWRSGDVAVLASSRLVALCEEAACAAVAGMVADGQTTVGHAVQFHHLAPAGPGACVTAAATLERVDGRRLTFTVTANDAHGLVGAGRMTRVVVEKERFLKRLPG